MWNIHESLQMMTLEEFLHRIFPDSRTRNYTLKFLAGCLSGELDPSESEVALHLFMGIGSNGKTTFARLCTATFGGTASGIHGTGLISSRAEDDESEAAVAGAEAAPKTKKLRIMEATDGNHAVSVSSLLSAALHSHLVLICTSPPPLVDYFVWIAGQGERYIAAIEFSSTFSSDPVANAEAALRDAEFQERWPAAKFGFTQRRFSPDSDLTDVLVTGWASEFSDLLLNVYLPMFREDGLQAPWDVFMKRL
jgi:hypothetical protein